MVDAKSQLNDALDLFATHGASAERSRLVPILTTSGAAVAAKDPRFANGLSHVADQLKRSDVQSMESLSFAWRATSVTSMREHRRRLVEMLGTENSIQEFAELPTRMADPEDRRHFADSLHYVNATWKPAFLARAIAAEREGEKARESLSRAFLPVAPVLSKQLSLIRESLAQEIFDQQEPEVGRARRAISIFEALADALWSSDAQTSPGQDFGDELSQFVSQILLRRQISDRTVSVQFSASVVNYAVVAARLHGSLAADAKTYSFLNPMRRAYGTANWPDVIQSQMVRAAGQVLDQLLLLVRLKMPDEDLRRVFVQMLGDADARRRLASAVEEEPGLDAEGSHWLLTGAARRTLATQSAIEETAIAAIDREIATALRELELLQSGFEQLMPELKGAAEFHSPALANRLSHAVDRLQRTALPIRRAAQKRGLTLVGNPGEVVEFNPVEHEPSVSAVGSRTVRMMSRRVERVLDGKVVGIILKADVDKA